MDQPTIRKRRCSRRFTRLLWPAALLLTASLAGCVSAAKAPRDSSPHQMTHPEIVENPTGHPDAWYEPNPIRVHVGQTITWTNEDSDPHDVTADDGAFYSGPIGAGGSWRWKALRPGTYTYFCTIHPDMRGTVIVTR